MNRPAVSPLLTAICTPPAAIAVARAMERFHTQNPVKYHRQRPSMQQCPFPTVTGYNVDEDGNRTEIMGPCPLVR